MEKGLTKPRLMQRIYTVLSQVHTTFPVIGSLGLRFLLASGAIYALGDLYLLSGEEVFKTAAKRIAEPLVGVVV